MKHIFILLGIIIMSQSGCSHAQENTPPAGQHRAKLSRQVTMELDYLIYLPQDYSKSDRDWPLMIFLHGAGERGNDLNLVKKHGPPKLVDQGKDLPFVIVSPQCPNNKWWPAMIEQVMALVDETIEHYNIDENRIYLTGLSMGGYGTWTIASAHPDRFAAIAPICGGGEKLGGHSLKDIPTWAFHGARDNVVPLTKSQEMVDAVNAAGGNAKLTVYPEAGHDSWTETYNNDQLYQWFLSHSKKQD